VCVCFFVLKFRRTVDDPQNSPEQEYDDESESLFTLDACDALDEHEVQCERRHDYRRVKQLHIATKSPNHTAMLIIETCNFYAKDIMQTG